MSSVTIASILWGSCLCEPHELFEPGALQARTAHSGVAEHTGVIDGATSPNDEFAATSDLVIDR
jgi:hypothetical protein